MNEREGIRPRAREQDPQTQTMVWGWPEGREGRAGWRWANVENMETSVIIVSTIKIKLKKVHSYNYTNVRHTL